MRVVLIDDEQSMRDNLRALLAKYLPTIEIIGEASGVASGVELLNTLSPDILFLDVEMKDGTGFDLLGQYGATSFQVIFVTGHDRYAIKAFKYSAIDYLLKPVDPAELQAAVNKVEAIETTEVQQKIDNLVANQEKSTEDRKLVLKDTESVYLIPVKEIIRCESDNNYTIFWLADGRKLMVSHTLKEYERMLDDQQFFRSHQSHLINLNYFDRYDKRDGGIIYMKDGTGVPLSTRKKDVFLEKLEQM
ncbi:MAG: LytTR family DNA-binding domain-containing protein [Bacteroidota bacterium]